MQSAGFHGSLCPAPNAVRHYIELSLHLVVPVGIERSVGVSVSGKGFKGVGVVFLTNFIRQEAPHFRETNRFSRVLQQTVLN